MESKSMKITELRKKVRGDRLERMALQGVPATQAAAVEGISTGTARRHYREVDFQRRVLDALGGQLENIDQLIVDRSVSIHKMLEAQSRSSFVNLIEMLDDPELPNSLRAKIHMDFMDRNPETSKKTEKRVDQVNWNIEAETLVLAHKTIGEMQNGQRQLETESNSRPG